MLVQLSHAPVNDQFKSTIMAILMALEVGSTPSFRPSYQEGAWPKNFFDAIIRSDCKRWILAVRKEKILVGYCSTSDPSWGVVYHQKDGTPKFRQYAMGIC